MLRLFHPFFTSLIFFFLILLFTSCSNQPNDENAPELIYVPVKGGIYRTPLGSDPATLDPAYIQDIYGITLVHQIFEGLVRYDRYLTVKPGLAKTWQVSDQGKTYRFTLKKNARFHNNEMVTSKDVVFSISRLLRIAPSPAILPHLLKIEGAYEYQSKESDHVSGLQIESDHKFTIRLQEAHVPFLTALGMYQAAIVPQNEIAAANSEFSQQPIGAGPFKLVAWEKGKSIRLKRFVEYHSDAAMIDELRYLIYPGGQMPILQDFKAGKLEEMPVFGDQKSELEHLNNLQWNQRPSLSLFFYGINVTHPNLIDPEFRKALSSAIDRATFVNKVYGGKFDIARTILPPGMPGYSPENQMMSFDPDSTDSYDHKTGLSNKKIPELEIVSSYKTPLVEKEIQTIQSYWSTLGVRIRVKYITDWEQYESYLKTDEVQIYRYVWFADMPDPDSFVYSLFSSDSPTNFMKFKNKEIDFLLNKARGIEDPIKRAGMYTKIESMLMKHTPLIPLFYMNVARVYQSYVKGVEINALGPHAITLNRVWLDKKTGHDKSE